jgi:hypothetical protein
MSATTRLEKSAGVPVCLRKPGGVGWLEKILKKLARIKNPLRKGVTITQTPKQSWSPPAL